MKIEKRKPFLLMLEMQTHADMMCTIVSIPAKKKN